MEPPSKRLRIGQAPYDDDDDDEANLDELSMDPTQFDARQDPLYQLDKGRAKAATRLKSAFERIFEKYEKDFTGIGDEINLDTGEVVIDNGHLLSLRDEKDRAREGSISSNEEERIMRGKEAEPVQGSNSKSLVRINSSTHNSSPGSHTTHSQAMTVNRATHQVSPPGMPPDPFGYPNPFMFGPSIFNRPVDPLWQSPEISIPLYQDRFGFMGHTMGYSHPPGYEYGMLPSGGSYGNNPLSLPRHQVSIRRPYTKTPVRKSICRVTPAEDDSEEDDILLGNNTQEVVKSADMGSKMSPPLAQVGEKSKQVDQKDDTQATEVVSRDISQKPRRGPGRPKKAGMSAKPPESSDETIQKYGGSAKANSSSETLSSASESATNLPPTSTSQSSLKSEESTPAEQLVTKLAHVQAQSLGDTESLDARHRRSSRSRKQTEFYGQISWTKGSGQRSESINLSDAADTGDEANGATRPLPLETSESSIYVGPDDSLHEAEIIQPELDKEFKDGDDKDPTRETDVATLDRELHDGLLVDQGVNSDGNEIFGDAEAGALFLTDFALSNSINFYSTAETSREPDSLFSNGEVSTEETSKLFEDNTALTCDEPRPSGSFSNDELCHVPQHSDQDTQTYGQTATSEENTTKDAEIALDIEATSCDLVVDEVLKTSNEIQESNVLLPDDIQESVLDPHVQEERDELPAELPDASRVESEFLESDVANRLGPTKQDSVLPRPPGNVMPHSEPNSITSQESKKAVPDKTSKLALRPSLVRNHSDPQPGSESGHVRSPSSSKNHPPSPANAHTKALVPRTPKKRRGSTAEVEHRSSSQHTTSTKKKFALTSLVPDDPDDEDELSVLSSSITPNPFHTSKFGYFSTNRHSSSPAATPRKTGRRQGFPVGSSTPHRVTKRTAPPATDSRVSRGQKRRFGAAGGGISAVQSSPLARTVMNMNADHSDIFTATPSRRTKNRDVADLMASSPVRTPGGTARRCGEDGFVCDRNFCFTCCK
ncbi:hypothetical protein F4677DRAFT_411911 [Hypoxylon crocopeplum]|nr:hypothetical protein F4677DRAFT_411911 [Hypoxylon crocopeplum]